ncbi:hypothetical protein [Halostella pelagica]|uniref:hypothetical protein n=1 Tax=Halostella pelagica TaxID=2583824 RepID=UPI001080F4DA|nr:hypothetical protein [Halostella pelagica]
MSPVAALSLNVTAAVAVVISVFILVSNRVGGTFYRWFGGLALLGHVATSVFVLPSLPFRWDIRKFHEHAIHLLSGVPPEGSSTVNSFAAFQSLVYTVFGTDPTTVSIINGLIGVLIAVPAADLAKQLYPNLNSTDGIVALILYFPLPFLFLTIPIRDALNVLVLFTILALAARGYRTNTPSLWLPTIPLFGMLSLLRRELVFAILCGVGVAAIIYTIEFVEDSPPSTESLVALAGFGGLVSLPIVGPRLPVVSIARRMEYRTRGGAAYLEFMQYDRWFDMLLAAPTRAIYFQFAPFPLHVTSTFDFLAAVMTPVLALFALAAYRSVSNCKTDRIILFGLATVYIVGILGYGIIDANFGTTVRHRIPFTFLLVVAAAPVVERWEQSLRSWVGDRPRHDSSQHE